MTREQSTRRMHRGGMGKAVLRVVVFACLSACGGVLDAGRDEYTPLPVDGRNPTVLIGDGFTDNWQGEYALLYAATGRLALTDIIVNDGPTWKEINDLVPGWREMTASAKASGMRNVPELTPSHSIRLEQPADNKIELTVPEKSEGAYLLIRRSKEVAKPYRPMVILTGAHLTDVASAYLIEPAIADRVVVVSALGSVTKTGGLMGIANGEMDPWAAYIVASKFRYVQVSTYYDPMSDVPDTLLDQLPPNDFSTWIRNKQPKVWNDLDAADQNAVSALVLPKFVTSFTRVTLQTQLASGGIPVLLNDDKGPIQLITGVSGALATSTLWQMLIDPATYSAK